MDGRGEGRETFDMLDASTDEEGMDLYGKRVLHVCL